MRILVTGGAGFIGSHLVDQLIDQKHEVIVIDNLSSGKKENVNPKARFYALDIGSPDTAMVINNEKVEVIFHLAAQMDVRKSVSDPAFDANTNIIGSLNLLEAGIKAGLKKFIFASTGGAIYGEQDYFPADENHPTRPISPYGISKLSLEKYLFYYHHVYDLNYTVLRFANVYGPRQNPHGEAGVVAIFCKKILNNEQPVINGDGKQTRDYTFVSDVVDANLKALEKGDNMIFNVGTGIETDVNTLFNTIVSSFGKEVPEVHAAAKAGEQLRSVLDYSKISSEMGWSPNISLENGLISTVKWFKDNH